MVTITCNDPDYSAGAIPANSITGATYYPESGVVVVSLIGKSGEPLCRSLGGQDGADLFNALVTISKGSYSVAHEETPPPEESRPPRPERPPIIPPDDELEPENHHRKSDTHKAKHK